YARPERRTCIAPQLHAQRWSRSHRSRQKPGADGNNWCRGEACVTAGHPVERCGGGHAFRPVASASRVKAAKTSPSRHGGRESAKAKLTARIMISRRRTSCCPAITL